MYLLPHLEIAKLCAFVQNRISGIIKSKTSFNVLVLGFT